MDYKKGFTLSEVLITLGVVSVLAAVITPAVMKVTPNTNKVMFRKAYFSLEEAVSKLINDDTNYPEVTIVSGVDCKVDGITVQCGFHNTDVTGSLVPATQDKFCYLLSEVLNTVGSVDCTPASIKANSSNWSFRTTDGIKWRVFYGYDSQRFPLVKVPTDAMDYRIIFDVNGDKKPNCHYNTIESLPNVLSSSGVGGACLSSVVPDIYSVFIRYDGKLIIQPGDVAGQGFLLDPLDNKK